MTERLGMTAHWREAAPGVTYPDGVWETTPTVTDDEARMDWPSLRDAPGWQRVVTGPSGHRWTWRPFPRFPNAPFRYLDDEPA